MTEEKFDAVADVIGTQLALQALLLQLIWEWGRRQDNPPAALAGYFRPVEQQLAAMVELPQFPRGHLEVCRATVRDMAEEIENLLHSEALRIVGEVDGVQ